LARLVKNACEDFVGKFRAKDVEQIGTFRIELAAIAAKRKLLQSAKLQLAALVRANESSARGYANS
jgi:hypothetical protein